MNNKLTLETFLLGGKTVKSTPWYILGFAIMFWLAVIAMVALFLLVIIRS